MGLSALTDMWRLWYSSTCTPPLSTGPNRTKPHRIVDEKQVIFKLALVYTTQECDYWYTITFTPCVAIAFEIWRCLSLSYWFWYVLFMNWTSSVLRSCKSKSKLSWTWWGLYSGATTGVTAAALLTVPLLKVGLTFLRVDFLSIVWLNCSTGRSRPYWPIFLLKQRCPIITLTSQISTEVADHSNISRYCAVTHQRPHL